MWITVTQPVSAAGTLTDNLYIDSASLNYRLQYRVYVPEILLADQHLPVIYVTDGQDYIEHGNMVSILDAQLASHHIKPVVVVFVDSREPDHLENNRRNHEFMCNSRYAQFYQNELIPAVESHFPAIHDREQRIIMGMSFGGLNAGCFGLMQTEMFAGIGMQSPASADHLKVLGKLYLTAPIRPLKIFLSAGTHNDNTAAIRRLHLQLVKQGYPVTYREVPFGHEWANWSPLIEDLLQTFIGNSEY